MADKVDIKPVGNPMKFPYTFSAQVAQFPIKYYIKNQWLWRYYFIAVGLSIPLFAKISKLANSPENKKSWAEKQAMQAKAEHH